MLTRTLTNDGTLTNRNSGDLKKAMSTMSIKTATNQTRVLQTETHDKARFEKLFSHPNRLAKTDFQQIDTDITDDSTHHCRYSECRQSIAKNTELNQILNAIKTIEIEDYLVGYEAETNEIEILAYAAFCAANDQPTSVSESADHPVNNPEDLYNLIQKQVDRLLISSGPWHPESSNTILLILGDTLEGSQLAITKSNTGWKLVFTCPDQITQDWINQTIPLLSQRMEQRKAGLVEIKVRSRMTVTKQNHTLR